LDLTPIRCTDDANNRHQLRLRVRAEDPHLARSLVSAQLADCRMKIEIELTAIKRT
jgi:hypothetical protein